MDESVHAAMAKWPDVPGLHGWLSLDESGQWRLKGDPITHPGLVGFINRNYDCDEDGRWFFQNGPQRGYIDLAYTPWVFHIDSAGELRDHTGGQVERLAGAWIDDGGSLLLESERGVGVVDADSLPAIAEWLVDDAGRAADPDALDGALAALEAGRDGGLRLRDPQGQSHPLGFVHRAEVPQRFGFDPEPRATNG